MRIKSILSILLILGISVALISSALSMGRAPLKKSVAAAEGTVEVMTYMPDAAFYGVDKGDRTGRVCAVGTRKNPLTYEGIIDTWIGDVPGWKVLLPFGGGVSAKAVRFDTGVFWVSGNVDVIAPGQQPTWDGFIYSFNEADGSVVSEYILTFVEAENAREDVIDMAVGGDRIHVVGKATIPRIPEEIRAAHAVYNKTTHEIELKRDFPVDTFGNSEMKAVAMDSLGASYFAAYVEKRPDGPITNDMLIFKLGPPPDYNTCWGIYIGEPDVIEAPLKLIHAGDVLYVISLYTEAGNPNPAAYKIDAATGDILATWTGINEFPTTGYFVEGSPDNLVVYGARGGNIVKRVFDESLSEVLTDGYITQHDCTPQDVLFTADADYLAASERDPDTQVNYGALYKWYKTVISPVAAIEELIHDVQSMNLQHGIDNSLDVKLMAAQEALEEAKKNATTNAKNKIQSFVNECEAQKGKALTEEQANRLIGDANKIIEVLQ